MDSTLCLYNQSGFCRYVDLFRNHHVQEICSINNCTNNVCRLRHPKPCTHFNTTNSCKFGDLCAYKHEMSIEQKNIIDLVNKIQIQEDPVNSMNMTLGVLENEIKQIKSKEDLKKTEISYEKCDQASSTTVLKHHITTNHRHTTLTPERRYLQYLKNQLTSVVLVQVQRDLNLSLILNHLDLSRIIPPLYTLPCKKVFINDMEGWRSHMVEQHNL